MLHPCIILQNGEKLKVVGHFTLYFSMLFCWFVASSIYVYCILYGFYIQSYIVFYDNLYLRWCELTSIIYFYIFLAKVKHNPIEIMITLPIYCKCKKCERESCTVHRAFIWEMKRLLITFLQHNVANCAHQADFNSVFIWFDLIGLDYVRPQWRLE